MTIGSLIGPYRIVEKIGAGGMGQVFLAVHTLLGRRAAVKTLLPALSAHHEIIERFFNEARATSAITDPGVVQIFDFGYHVDGTAYIVMELLEGESLADRIERLDTLPLADALRIVRQCAGSIAAAHARGIVHRDLKPENIFLVPDAEASGGERPKVLDFGICKLATSDAMTTQTGTMFGTPAYMSPEQCRGAGGIDQRSDIYAFGCLLFHMLTGRPPFWKDAPGELLVAHMHEDPPRPSDFLPSIPAEVDAVVLRCLAKDPADRFATMLDLQATVAQVELDVAIDAAPDLESRIDAAIDAAPEIDITVEGDDEAAPHVHATPVPRTARRMSVATPRPTPPPRFSTGGSGLHRRHGSGPHGNGHRRSADHVASHRRDGSGPHGHRDGQVAAHHRDGSGPHRRDGSGPHRDGSGPHRHDGHRDADAVLEPHRLDGSVLARARWNDSGDQVAPRGHWTEPHDDDVVPPRRFRGLRALFLSAMVIAEIAAVIAIVLARGGHHQPAAMPEPVASDPLSPGDPMATDRAASPDPMANDHAGAGSDSIAGDHASPNPDLTAGDRASAGTAATASPVAADSVPSAAEIDRAIAGEPGPATAAAAVAAVPAAAPPVAVEQKPAATRTVPPRERTTPKHAVAKKQPPAPRQRPVPAPIVIEPKPSAPQPPTTEELYETR